MPCDEGVIDALIGRPYNRTSAPVRAHPRTTIAAPSFNGRTADSGSAYRGSNPWGAAKLESITYLSNRPARKHSRKYQKSPLWRIPDRSARHTYGTPRVLSSFRL